MSLGPPFDDSEGSDRLRMGLGGAAAALLLFVAGFAVLTAERSLGDAITIHLDVARTGTLHTGAPLLSAGDAIGEVVAIRGRRRDATPTLGTVPPTLDAAPPFAPQAPSIDVEIRLLRRFQDRVRRNSTIVTVNPTLLTEAQLEVGPPLAGAAPAEPIHEGDHLRGIDPADMSILMLRVYRSLEEALRETRDLAPDWTEFQAATSTLSADIGQTLPPADTLRLALHFAQARSAVLSLRDKLRQNEADTAPARLQTLNDTTRPLLAEVTRLAHQLETLEARTRDFQTALSPRTRDLQHAVTQFKHATDLASRAQADVQALVWMFENGRGTLGGFNRDIQLFDELKEMHRILKRESWRVIIKRKPR